MKKLNYLIILVVLFTLAACGSSGSGGGGGTGSEIAQRSSDEFVEIMEYCFSEASTHTLDVDVAKEVTSCSCPGGGTATMDDVTFIATMVGCKSDDNYSYTGAVLFDTASGDVDINFLLFGGCAGVEGAEITSGTDSCSGSITGTCGGDSIECDFVPDGDDCNLDC